MKQAVYILAAASALVATPSFAQAYVGVIGGYDSVELEFDDVSGDSEGVAYGVVAGYDANIGGAVLGIEAELSDSSVSERAEDIDVAGDSAKLSAGRDIYLGGRIGFNATDRFMVYAKGGYTNARAKLTYDDGVDVYSDSDELEGYRIGAGLEYKAGMMGVRTEFRYSDYGDYKYDGFNTGISARRSQIIAGLTFGF